MRELEQIVKDFVLEASEDNVGLWRIVNAVRHEFGEADEARVQAISLKVVEELLNHGLEVVDYYQGRGWARWPDQDAQAILARIDREWNVLGREPNLGDICWFSLPKREKKGAG